MLSQARTGKQLRSNALSVTAWKRLTEASKGDNGPYLSICSGLVWPGLAWSGLVWSGLFWPGRVLSKLVFSSVAQARLISPGLAWSGLTAPRYRLPELK